MGTSHQNRGCGQHFQCWIMLIHSKEPSSSSNLEPKCCTCQSRRAFKDFKVWPHKIKKLQTANVLDFKNIYDEHVHWLNRHLPTIKLKPAGFFPPGIRHHGCFHQIFIGFPCPSMSELEQSLPGPHKTTGSNGTHLFQQILSGSTKNWQEPFRVLGAAVQSPKPWALLAIDLLFRGPIPLASWKDVRWRDHWNSVCGQRAYRSTMDINTYEQI